MTLDLAMPGLDGMGVLQALRDGKADRCPVVVVSAFSPAHGARAVDALAEGAFDLVAKPAIGEPMDGVLRRARRQGRRGRGRRAPAPAAAAPRRPGGARRPAARRRAPGARHELVVIACSTGGPRALAELIPALPAPPRRAAR